MAGFDLGPSPREKAWRGIKAEAKFLVAFVCALASACVHATNTLVSLKALGFGTPTLVTLLFFTKTARLHAPIILFSHKALDSGTPTHETPSWFSHFFYRDQSSSCSNHYFPARRLILVLRPIQPHLGFVTIFTESRPDLDHWRRPRS